MDIMSIALDFLKGLGLLFVNPLFYTLVLFSFYIGTKRVKRERIDFHTRVNDVVDDLLIPLFPGLLASLILSFILISLGIIFPIGILILLVTVHFILLLIGNVRLISPAYVGGLSLVIALILPEFKTGYTLIDRWIVDITQVNLSSFALFIGFLIIAEGVLIYKNGWKSTSPSLSKSKRGKMIGGHQAQRLWILPLLVIVPGNAFAVFQYWPIIPTDYTNVGFVFIPIAVGFHQMIRSTLPMYAVRLYGKRVLLIGISVTILSIVSMYVPILIPLIALITLISREVLAVVQKMKEDHESTMYTQRKNGLLILGVIPGSPADKLKVKIGEVITKVNGSKVTTAQDFYEALQKNSAFCKLEVIDENGEIRYAQTAVYHGEHHQIGLLFVNN